MTATRRSVFAQNYVWIVPAVALALGPHVGAASVSYASSLGPSSGGWYSPLSAVHWLATRTDDAQLGAGVMAFLIVAIAVVVTLAWMSDDVAAGRSFGALDGPLRLFGTAYEAYTLVYAWLLPLLAFGFASSYGAFTQHHVAVLGRPLAGVWYPPPAFLGWLHSPGTVRHAAGSAALMAIVLTVVADVALILRDAATGRGFGFLAPVALAVDFVMILQGKTSSLPGRTRAPRRRRLNR